MMRDAEELRKPGAVRDAKFEGVMCSALVELVCEALASSGRERSCLSDTHLRRKRCSSACRRLFRTPGVPFCMQA